MDAFHRLSRFGSLMLRARALGVALLIASVGFGGGICVAFVCASWNNILYLAEKHVAMDAFHRLSQLFDGAITSAPAMGMLWPIGISIAAVIVVVGAALLWWWGPKWQMQSVTTGDPKARADIEDNFRKTVGQALGGIAVLIGAWLAYHGTQQTLQANQDQSRLSQQASRDLLISQQVAKGFEQLGQQGPDKMVLRLGGIYALEGVMNGSEQYHQPVLEALCAFVREGTRTHDGDNPPATDIQAALTVITRRGPGEGDVDLHFARIPKANLRNVTRRVVEIAVMNLPPVPIHYGIGADLTDANLSGADLTGANLSTADLNSANLSSANLSGANLIGANLDNANLSGVNLIGTKLSGVTVINQSQLDRACGANAKLPPDLTLKPCPDRDARIEGRSR
jgi:hypothetical protein